MYKNYSLNFSLKYINESESPPDRKDKYRQTLNTLIQSSLPVKEKPEETYKDILLLIKNLKLIFFKAIQEMTNKFNLSSENIKNLLQNLCNKDREPTFDNEFMFYCGMLFYVCGV